MSTTYIITFYEIIAILIVISFIAGYKVGKRLAKKKLFTH